MASLSHGASMVTNLNQKVFLPKAKDEVDPQYSEIHGLLGFIGAIIGAMQNYRDNTQARLPSYRERIVQIRFDNEREGGLNLAMNSATIQSIGERGGQAAQKLLPGGEFDFKEHMWVRLRVLMTQLEEHLEALEKGYPNISTYERLLEEQLEHLNDKNAQFYCGENREWCEEAIKRIKVLIALIDGWKAADANWKLSHTDWSDPHFFAVHAPEPQPVLRITPNL